MKLTSTFYLKLLTLILLSFFGISILSAQNDSIATDEKHSNKKHKKEKKEKKPDGIVWIPVLASSPANGFMYGVAPSRNWKSSPDEETSYSNVLGSVVFTTLSQLLLTLKGSLYGPQNKSIVMADIRYFQTSQPTYGLGTGDGTQTLASSGFEFEDGEFTNGIDEAQMMKFNFLRLYATYFKSLKPKGLYAGVGYHLDVHSKIEDQLLYIDPDNPANDTITSHYAYSIHNDINPEKYTLSGVSGNVLYDTRDNTVSPYKGMYGFLTLKYNPEWLGSEKNSSTLWAEYRTYFNLKKERPRNVLAVWTYGSFELSGKLPYLDLPAVGWDQFGRSGRAYPQGRFRGEQLMYGEMEWRFPLQKNKDKWGAVIFANTTTASNKEAEVNLFKNFNFGTGFGVRYALNEKSRTNLCLDFGIGDNGAKGFYLSVNEVF